MTSGGRPRFLLPVIGKHVAVEFLRAFALTVLAFLAIYVLADFFDRFDSFLRTTPGRARSSGSSSTASRSSSPR